MIGGLIAIITGLVGLVYYLKKLNNEGNKTTDI
jgi:hypothetical protein